MTRRARFAWFRTLSTRVLQPLLATPVLGYYVGSRVPAFVTLKYKVGTESHLAQIWYAIRLGSGPTGERRPLASRRHARWPSNGYM
ncbi:hypothetical protein EVAR_53869_1 [Eumeta japonica]|uniref:Uncharacterized protein n=1 Tax=Eumeta variegata TaxID=151549 RepID=A0A4C1XDV1_EUMVA|nr:hypothetical protein EVAR_53869_1 [Eumeta japonica]